MLTHIHHLGISPILSFVITTDIRSLPVSVSLYEHFMSVLIKLFKLRADIWSTRYDARHSLQIPADTSPDHKFILTLLQQRSHIISNND